MLSAMTAPAGYAHTTAATQIAGVGERTLCRRIAAGELHPVRDPRDRRRLMFPVEELRTVFGIPDLAAPTAA